MVNGNGKPLKSSISGFHELDADGKLAMIRKFSDITDEDAEVLRKTGALSIKSAEMMIENVIGTTEYPIGIATNFLVNGRDYLVPMALEEPRVVAAARNAAKK